MCFIVIYRFITNTLTQTNSVQRSEGGVRGRGQGGVHKFKAIRCRRTRITDFYSKYNKCLRFI